MRHMQGDTIYARDCVLLKSGSRKNDLPFIAKIANLWEDPVSGEYQNYSIKSCPALPNSCSPATNIHKFPIGKKIANVIKMF